MWASSRIRAFNRSRPKPYTVASVTTPPSSPARVSRSSSSTGLNGVSVEPIRAAASLQRWLRTRGAPEALRLLRAVGATAKHALDDVELAANALAHSVDETSEDNGMEEPGPAEPGWSLWGLALRIVFWLVFVLLAVFRRIGRIRARASRNWRAAKRRAAMLQRLNQARTYKDWASAAEELDRIEGRAKWKDEHRPHHTRVSGPHSTDYRGASKGAREWSAASKAIHDVCDLDMLTAKLGELSRLYEAGDVRGLAFALRASLQRNYSGICHPGLSSHSRIGTSRVAEDYVHVVSYLLAYIAQSPLETTLSEDSAFDSRHLNSPNKLLMFNEARIAYGRTALMLSGGASMGINHLGVCKALLDQNLMPKVVCGTSAGALVASIVGIFDDTDLLSILNSPELINPLSGLPFSFKCFDEHTSWARRARRFIRSGVIQDVRMLQDCLRKNFGDVTFQEAYTRTRRILNITCCAARTPSDPPMLLNYLTAPHVLVWSAAAASCALPFVFAPVELVAKAYDGRVVPYHPRGVRWIDGSITSDIPLARIGELFNVNHFIVSQTNPHVIPRGAPLMKTRAAMLIKSELQFRYWQATQLNLVPRFLSAIFPHFMQPYEGDVTIMPEVTPGDIRRLLQNPSIEQIQDCILRGQQSAFPYLDRIRRQCIIEKALDASVEHVARQRGAEDNPYGSGPSRAAMSSANQKTAVGKRDGKSFFGRVPSWLWLDPSSLLSHAPAAVASRISGAATPSTPPPPLPQGPRTPEELPLPPPSPHIPILDPKKLRTARSPIGSPPGRSELEKMWIELGVNAAAERAFATTTAVNTRPESDAEEADEDNRTSSGSEEDRVMC